MIDLGLGVMRRNAAAEVARQLARQAIVHGKLAASPWSPATGAYPGQSPYSVPVTSSTDAIAQVVNANLATLDPSALTVTVAWPDGDNDMTSDNRVQVTVSCTYRPVTTVIASFTITATSTMTIAH